MKMATLEHPITTYVIKIGTKEMRVFLGVNLKKKAVDPDEKLYMGINFNDMREIYIDLMYHPHEVTQTFFHEVFHSIDNCADTELTEHQVSVLSDSVLDTFIELGLIDINKFYDRIISGDFDNAKYFKKLVRPDRTKKDTHRVQQVPKE